MMRYFWNYHTSNPGHDHLLAILITKSIIKYDVPGIHWVALNKSSNQV
ncbi:hypothetical protein KsCSTR_38400 [Candidatus Kuenenia stuttgartiensis]|uniref:Uncharacterized protein n=1 Tax=Kuenenia stuttgartiensis TaxID=174633 RepID=A0A6G7GVC0_KUEST|nr:hypothetical protein KsCSTR_38400 [Candidatus Kuenenia stuttgartiensis]